jgi:LPS-assembly lipoprotein
MSSFDLSRRRTKWLTAGVFAVSVVLLQACQVQPLYSSNSHTAANLASVEISPATTRVGQVLRNHLIFLYSGGKGEPANPDYTLNVSVTGAGSAILREELTAGITAQRYSAAATFTLTDKRTKKIVDTGTRRVVTFYDQTTQEFANKRALRDAENRAARQLAEIIRADTASILSR